MSNEEEHLEHDAEAKAKIIENVEKYGCHLALLEADNYLPGFAYTIGLYKNYNHPEVIVFGLHTNVMGAVLNHARDLIQKGEVLQEGKLYKGFLEGFDITFLKVHKDHYKDYLGYGGWFYNQTYDFPILQLVWPDKLQKFPWEEGFNENWKFKQPLLDRNTDFKFYEERNLGVYTTKQVLEEGYPILLVDHDEEDGSWQFLCGTTNESSDLRIVALDQITKIDPSVNDIYHIQYGYRAWRNTINDEWQVEPNE